MIRNLGYCCINTSLKEYSPNRTVAKETFEKFGQEIIVDKVYQNLFATKRILEWNLAHNIFLYRVSSEIFPWMSQYEISELQDFENVILPLLEDIGNFVKRHKIRLTFHPGPYNVLGSDNPLVVEKTIKELNQHREILNWMGLEASLSYPINIHLSTTKGGKDLAIYRFLKGFERLNSETQKSLTIENDDSINGYSIEELFSVHKEVGVALCFDFFHYDCGAKGNLSKEESFEMACNSWGEEIPITHFSSSRRIYEDFLCKSNAHADFLHEKIPDFILSQVFDVEIEAKGKERALLNYRKVNATTESYYN